MTIQTEILAINNAFDAAFNAKDAGAISALFADDACVMPAPGGDVVTGRGAIKNLFAGSINAGVIDHKLTQIAAVVDGNLAYQTGKWSGAMIDEAGVRQTFGGNVHLVYRKQADGTWLAVSHIWN